MANEEYRKTTLFSCLGMLCKPESQLIFLDLTGRKAQKCQVCIFLSCSHGKIVELKKDEGHLHGSPFISIDKRVIAGDAERI